MNVRKCNKCSKKILVGNSKIGKAVFPGGVCYDCIRRFQSVKLK